MAHLDLALIDWTDPELGPRILGRFSDPDLIDLARQRLAARRRRELADLEPSVRLVDDPDDPDAGATG